VAGKIGSGAVYGGSAMPTVAGAGQDVTAEINMTPMIDVMLVLLIIFMVITPAMAGYVAQLPKAVTSAPEKEDRVTLGIDNQGRFYVGEDGKAIPLQQLTSVLQQAYATRPNDHVLYMKADQGVEYSVVLSGIDAARAAGVRRIGAITERPTAPKKEE
jgi:biopolymer transport protein ExbD